MARTSPRGYHCFAIGARCGLCRFDLEEGELVVAGTHDSDVSETFPFSRAPGWADAEYKSTKIGVCCHRIGPEGHCPNAVPLHHAECFRIGASALSPGLLAATAYSFEPMPMPLGDRRRENYLRYRAVAALERAFPNQHLPDELWLKVAELLIRESAASAAAQTEVENAPHPSPPVGEATSSTVDLSRDVYASYVVFDGVRYIRNLRNTAEAEAPVPGEHLVLQSAKDRSVQNVHVAFDHLGVRLLQFASPNRVLPGPDSVEGLWWRLLSQQEGISKLEIQRDGLKLRGVYDPSSDTEAERDIAWSVRDPGSATLLVHTDCLPPRFTCNHMPRSYHSRLNRGIPLGLRMLRLECNFPRITGYSVASHEDRVYMIHAHRDGEAGPGYDWLRKYTSMCHWIYMPVNPGEYVAEVWLSPMRLFNHNKSQGLAFVTNRGNHTSFVPWYSPPKTSRERSIGYSHPDECVHKPAKNGSALYFSALDPVVILANPRDGHAHFAFENAGPVEKKGQRPKSAMPASAPMQTRYLCDVYFSSCRLEDAVEVVPCRSRPGNNYPPGVIIGMLVRYANGDRACVGTFRFDWAAEPCEVGRTGRLYIGCKRELKRVLGIGNRLPQTDDGLSWTDITLSGKLEWWFSYADVEVHHIEDAQLESE